jgi:hypothetical protein
MTRNKDLSCANKKGVALYMKEVVYVGTEKNKKRGKGIKKKGGT